jgi:lysozyme family protein
VPRHGCGFTHHAHLLNDRWWTAQVDKIIQSKVRYAGVGQGLGIPWYVIA